MPKTDQEHASPSPPFGSTDHLLPPQKQLLEHAQPPSKTSQLLQASNLAGREDLVVVGIVAGLLLAGVVVGAAFLQKGEGTDRMAALRKKFTATEAQRTTTIAKEKAKTKRLDRQDEEQETDELEPEGKLKTDEDTTMLFLEEEDRSTKKAKARRKPKTRSRSVKRRTTTEE